jgi:hypothetical protein
MFLAQYSFAELTSKMFGQVLVAEHRTSLPLVLPVTESTVLGW